MFKGNKNSKEFNEERNARAKKNREKGLCHCGRTITEEKTTRCTPCRKTWTFWYKGLPYKRTGYTAQYYKNNKEKIAKQCKERNRNLRQEVLKEYGSKCTRCGIKNPFVLQIDHINNDGAAHRKKLRNGGSRIYLYRWLKENNFPKENFQILCANCNWCKGIFKDYPDNLWKET